MRNKSRAAKRAMKKSSLSAGPRKSGHKTLYFKNGLKKVKP